MENHHFQWENPLFLWPFSIAMLNYQRVNHSYSGKHTKTIFPHFPIFQRGLQVHHRPLAALHHQIFHRATGRFVPLNATVGLMGIPILVFNGGIGYNGCIYIYIIGYIMEYNGIEWNLMEYNGI